MPKTITPDERFQASIEGFPVAGEPVEIEPIERAFRAILSNTVTNRRDIDSLFNGVRRVRSAASLTELAGIAGETGEVVLVPGYGLYAFDREQTGATNPPWIVQGVGGVWRNVTHLLVGQPNGVATLNAQGEVVQPVPDRSITFSKLHLTDGVGTNYRLGGLVLHDGGVKFLGSGIRWNSTKQSWEHTGGPSGGVYIYNDRVGLVWSQPDNPDTNATLINTIMAYPESGDIVVYGNLLAPRPYNLGSFGSPWETLFVRNGVVTTSDVREKTDIAPSDLGLNFILSLRPVKYRRRIGGFEWDGFETVIDEVTGQPIQRPRVIPRAGRRFHYGLIAQDVKQLVDSLNIDFGGLKLEDPSKPESKMSLDYAEFIAPLIQATQELAEQVNRLRERLDALEAALNGRANDAST